MGTLRVEFEGRRMGGRELWRDGERNVRDERGEGRGEERASQRLKPER